MELFEILSWVTKSNHASSGLIEILQPVIRLLLDIDVQLLIPQMYLLIPINVEYQNFTIYQLGNPRQFGICIFVTRFEQGQFSVK